MPQESKGAPRHSNGNSDSNIRPPSQAVRAIYGDAPIHFRNRALIQAESSMRFERLHPEDFQETNWESWCKRQFRFWVHHNDNKVFKEYYDSTSPGEQAALLRFVLGPFSEIDEIINDWEFADGEISCYTYV